MSHVFEGSTGSDTMGAECSVVAVDADIEKLSKMKLGFESSFVAAVYCQGVLCIVYIWQFATLADLLMCGEVVRKRSKVRAKTLPPMRSISSQSTCSGSDLDKQTSSQSTNRFLEDRSMLVNVSDVKLKKELCTTCKNTVSIARWRGRYVAAKQMKTDQRDAEHVQHMLADMSLEVQILSDTRHPCRLAKMTSRPLKELEKAVARHRPLAGCQPRHLRAPHRTHGADGQTRCGDTWGSKVFGLPNL